MKNNFAAVCALFLAASFTAFGADAKPPSVGAIVEKYIEKIGGQANLAKIKSRVSKGDLMAGDAPVPWSEYTQDGKKRTWILEIPNADVMSRVLDGDKGWAKEPDGTVKDMEGDEIKRAKMEAAFRHQMNPKGVYDLVFEKSEQANGETLHVLKAKTPAGADWLTFSDKTGLLVRFRAEWDSGSSTYEETFEDYRDVEGVLFPFTRKGKVNDFEFTIKLKEVKHNTPIDAAIFTKPKAS